jgi:hypothetical protein
VVITEEPITSFNKVVTENVKVTNVHPCSVECENNRRYDDTQHWKMDDELHAVDPLNGLDKRCGHEEVQDETKNYENQS